MNLSKTDCMITLRVTLWFLMAEKMHLSENVRIDCFWFLGKWNDLFCNNVYRQSGCVPLTESFGSWKRLDRLWNLLERKKAQIDPTPPNISFFVKLFYHFLAESFLNYEHFCFWICRLFQMHVTKFCIVSTVNLTVTCFVSVNKTL